MAGPFQPPEKRAAKQPYASLSGPARKRLNTGQQQTVQNATDQWMRGAGTQEMVGPIGAPAGAVPIAGDHYINGEKMK